MASLFEYKTTVAAVATVVTIMQFLSGIDICRHIVKEGTTAARSGFTFVGGVFSCSMWFTYSFLIDDYSMMTTNLVGLFLQLSYLVLYLRYCIEEGSLRIVLRQMMVLFSFGLFVLGFSFISGMGEEARFCAGLVSCGSSIVFCAAPLASMTEVIRTRSTKVLPFPLICCMFCVASLWCLYGFIIGDPFVLYPNLICSVIAVCQLALFVVFRGARKTI